MPGPQVDSIYSLIVQALPRFGSLDAAGEAVRGQLDTLKPGLSQQLASEFEEALERVRQQFERIEILHRHSVFHVRPRWYFGPQPTDLHWPAVCGYYLNEKRWPQQDVERIDEASNEVVSLLENPHDPLHPQFSCRGLVVGHVQSGKTANMTAVIAKAMDAGYNTVIVLAGLTNKLRMQTQLRLFTDLVKRNPLNWQVLTPNEIDGDFRAPPLGGFLSHVDKAQLAVIKKNVSPLRELKRAIRRTLPAVLERLRVLVIDDECDQASVNAASRELDMTAINRWIREILASLPAVSYVGYTATPFANVLINPYRPDGQGLDDLYPRDFITALPKSESYFGTERLFGRTPDDPENPRPGEEGLDMIRDVQPEDETRLQPRSRQERNDFRPEMVPSLERAILYFLAACAARRARGDAGQHMTMLVHTSAYVVLHQRVADLIQRWVQSMGAELLRPGSPLGRRMAEIWEDESTRLPNELTQAPRIGTDEVFRHLPPVLEALEFPIENGASDDRIDYSGDPRTYIVVGGSILSRGLTLEGLMVSYFLRTANQYDTLLQMGRWFGYRPGYEDLPRIWMPEELKLRFRALAAVEQEVRDEIDQYRQMRLTPMDIPVRIRAIPGMAITAATKMRAATQCAVSYWGTHRQTFRFSHQDAALLTRNWAAGAELVDAAGHLGLRNEAAGEPRLWQGVPKELILKFFGRYAIEPTHADLLPSMLLPFLELDDERLEHWNLAVVESGRGKQAERALGAAGSVRTVRRARLKDSGRVADIKALMSRADVLLDCGEGIPAGGSWEELKTVRRKRVGDVPLLLLYPIEARSEPEPASKVRAPLDAVHDVLGVGIIFPGSVAEGGNYVSVELRTVSAEDLVEIEEAEAAQAEAAGVE